MKKFKKSLLLGCCLAVFLSSVFGEGLLSKTKISVSGDFAFNSSYIFRGQKLDKADVMQAGIYAEGHGLSLGVWKSQTSRAKKDVSSEETDCSSEEIDYSIGYSKSFDKLNIGIGFTHYDYPLTVLGEREINASASLDVLFAPSIMVANNYTNDILYYELGLSHGLELTEYISANIGVIYGRYNSEILDGGYYYDSMLGLDMKLTDNLVMSPNIHFMNPHGNLANANLGASEDEIYGGVTFGYSF